MTASRRFKRANEHGVTRIFMRKAKGSRKASSMNWIGGERTPLVCDDCVPLPMEERMAIHEKKFGANAPLKHYPLMTPEQCAVAPCSYCGSTGLEEASKSA